MVKDLPNYQTNEAECTVAGLETYVTELKQVQKHFDETKIALNKARIERFRVLYQDKYRDGKCGQDC